MVNGMQKQILNYTYKPKPHLGRRLKIWKFPSFVAGRTQSNRFVAVVVVLSSSSSSSSSSSLTLTDSIFPLIFVYFVVVFFLLLLYICTDSVISHWLLSSACK
jgi:hypothetical protein